MTKGRRPFEPLDPEAVQNVLVESESTHVVNVEKETFTYRELPLPTHSRLAPFVP